ncbi:autotransporter domain-containing protein [Oceanicaulis alexandrii]|uniref:autotransporter domain-containing protein n=1 Tax=Oceanicaulis alexandrii TaxID=153233 RepID=UPI0003B42C82|nr:autotransporter outer membrane beta-barrel domain-containing protein [Oceanicaulis alexandrii]
MQQSLSIRNAGWLKRPGLKVRLLSSALGCGLLALQPAASAQDGPITDTDTLTQSIQVEADATVNIVVDAPLATDEDGQPAILGRSWLGGVIINSLDVLTSGVMSDGIFAQSFADEGEILIVSGDVETTGIGSRGIVASNEGAFPGSLTQIFSGNVTTAGADAIGIHATAKAGAITLESLSVTTSGDGATGIQAHAESGDVQLLSNDVTTSGLNAVGIQAEASDFVIVDSLDVATSGDGAHGIVAEAGMSAYVRSQSVKTEGEQAHGIVASSTGQIAYVESQTLTTQGDGSIGILARSNGSVAVRSGSVTTQGEAIAGGDGGDLPPGDGGDLPPGDGGDLPPGDGGGDPFPPSKPVGALPATPGGGAMGIVAISDGADVFVESGFVSTTGSGATGIHASAQTDTIVISDEIQTSGESAIGLLARSRFGDVSVSSGAVSTQGDFSTGISLLSESGNVLVLSEALSTEGFDSAGIRVTANKNVIVDSQLIETTGDSSSGIQVLTQTGEVDINSGDITTQGEDSDAISVIGLGGGSDVRISSGAITTIGDGSDGIFVNTFGDVSIAADTIATSGESAAGIYADAGGDLSVQVNDVTTDGALSAGISLQSNNGGVTVNAGRITTTGDSSAGIEAVAFNGDIDINVTEIDVSGDRYLPGDGGGELPVDPNPGGGPASTMINGNVIGIAASSFNSDISVTAGKVTASGLNTNGINVFATGGRADVTAGTVDVDGVGGVIGLRARGDLGAHVIVDSIRAVSTLENTAPGETDPFSEAISVGAVTGQARVQANSVRTEGSKMTGVEVIAVNASILAEIGEVVVIGEGGGGGIRTLNGADDGEGGRTDIRANSILTDGDYITGVRAISLKNFNDIRVGQIQTDGRQSVGVFSASQSGATIEVGEIVTTGDVSDGIQAINRTGLNGGEGPLMRDPSEIITGDGEPDETPGGGEDGVSVATGASASSEPLPGTVPDGDISITAGSVSTSGDSSRGIAAHANGDVTIVSGSVSTTGERTSYFSTTDYQFGLSVSGLFEFEGPASHGIDARSDYGSISIESQSVSTLGVGAHGIRAETGEGDISVQAGDISVSGQDADGLHLVSQTGDVTATVEGHVRAEQGAGVRIASAGTIELTIANGGWVDSADGAFAVVIEPGLVPDDPIIPEDPVSILAAQSLGGTATPVTSGASLTVDAGGVLQGRIQLTDGDDTLQIAGRFLASGTSLFGGGDDTLINTGSVFVIDGATAFDGLERFENQGLFSLTDGDAGDSLDLSDITFIGGEGSVLAFDVLSDGAGGVLADDITFGLVQGTTEVEIMAEAGLTLDASVDLITFTRPVADDAFRIRSESADAGFMQWTLRQSADRLTLAATPDVEVFEIIQAGGVATDLWHEGAQVIRQQAALSRSTQSGSGDGLSGWIEAASTDRNGAEMTLSTQHAGSTVSQALSRDLSASSISAGLTWRSGAAHFGAALGYVDGRARFDGTGNEMEMEAFSLSGYGGWSTERYFANLIGKLDTGTLELNVISANERSEMDVTTFGLNGELGARFQSGETYVEPTVSMSWVSASLGEAAFSTGAFELEDGDSLKAEIGARVGHAFTTGAWTVRPTAAAYRVEELAGENTARYASGASQLALQDEPAGSYTRLELGAAFETGAGLVLSISGEAFDGDQSGGALRLGGRMQF